MDDIRFDGRVAIVTGAGAGLGRTYALALAEKGAMVVVNDLGGAPDGSGASNRAADEVVADILDAGGKAVANYDSVATKQGGDNIVKTAVDAFGKVDILINNAGILRDKSFLKLEEAEWDIVLAVHLKGAFNVAQPAFKIMKENSYGRIINTASGAGLYGNFGQVNYCAAKMGLVGLMNNICIEGARYNILCNAIAPIAASRLTKDVLPPSICEKLKPEFVTPLVLYLVSEQNTDSKMIFNCAAGWFSRTEILCAPGICLGDGKRPVKAEEVRDNWAAITSMEQGRPLANITESFGFLGSILS
ncbi:MAG: SDR family oxidoreductase [Proteobacteria bacterium]|nr:SDR family oxidoreductase [Pseudomonadota bacterium]